MENPMDIIKDVSNRKSKYLWVIKDGDVKEFIENYESDCQLIKELKIKGVSGLVRKEVDDLESVLLQVPQQMYAMIQLRRNHEENK